ncbi:hypothetical protein CAEBREN_01132 [Caenorhabditis brenneri]|uniref:Serpentine Receptor, class Z n=1 Tax=Caenorhabditis brenneri TaxID=135651 RepID=G0NTL6_CAEBE|nr:hypothetical protein CAEBREN_01132 [Caenorhabditis brenneri]
MNRNHDKKTAIYPVTNHFYKVICFNYVFFLVFLTFSIIVFLDLDLPFYVSIVLLELYQFSGNTYFYFFNVHHVILTLLTIQRFALYFYPGLEKLIVLNQRTTNRILFCIYTVFFTTLVAWFVYGELYREHREFEELMVTVTLYEYFILYIVLVLASLLYIPIMISIRKHSHLASFKKSTPDRYILYQTVLVVVLKTVSSLYKTFQFGSVQTNILNAFFFNPEESTFFDKPHLDLLIYLDILSTPVLIQVSYLFCNQKNMEAMKSKLNVKSYLRLTLFCCFHNSEAEVHPCGNMNYAVSTIAN